MKFSFTAIFAFANVLACVAASPIAKADASSLEKRDADIVGILTDLYSQVQAYSSMISKETNNPMKRKSY
jgi:hypothetical protein